MNGKFRLVLGLVALAAMLFLHGQARSQGVTRLCFAPLSPAGNSSCLDVTAANPLPVVGMFDLTVTSPLPVIGTFWQATQPVSAVSLPLPANASTEATLTAIKAKTDNIDVALSTRAVTGLTDAQLRATPVPVSGTFYQATQPVSGAFWQATQPVSIASMPSTPVTGTFWQATQPVSAASLPLPAGAATEATLTLIKAKTDNLDVALSTRAITGLTDTQLRASAVPVSGSFFQATQPVLAAALPLPANAAQEVGGNLAGLAAKDFSTSAKQDTTNTSLASLNAKIALGQLAVAQALAVTVINNTQPVIVSRQVPLTGRVVMAGRASR